MHRVLMGFVGLSVIGIGSLAAVPPPESMVAARTGTMILDPMGRLSGFGGNFHGGLLGVGDEYARYVIHTQPGVANWNGVWTEEHFSIATRTDGTLWGAGYDGYYRYGAGTSIPSSNVFRQIGTNYCM